MDGLCLIRNLPLIAVDAYSGYGPCGFRAKMPALHVWQCTAVFPSKPDLLQSVETHAWSVCKWMIRGSCTVYVPSTSCKSVHDD